MTCIKIFGIEIVKKFGNEIWGFPKIFGNEMRPFDLKKKVFERERVHEMHAFYHKIIAILLWFTPLKSMILVGLNFDAI
jgi:hypothetical protein